MPIQIYRKFHRKKKKKKKKKKNTSKKASVVRAALGPWKFVRNMGSLRKHAYSNKLKILPPKTEHFQIFFFFHVSAQNIDVGTR